MMAAADVEKKPTAIVPATGECVQRQEPEGQDLPAVELYGVS